MQLSDLIKEIEAIRSEIKQYLLESPGIVDRDLLAKARQLLKKTKDELEKNGDAKLLLEQILTMIEQLEENINRESESSTLAFEKWDKTLNNVEEHLKTQDKRFQKVEEEDKRKSRKIQDLEKDVKEMKVMKESLAFGQIGFLFEQEVAKHVLSEDEAADLGNVNVYKKMIKWLNEKKSDEATERWDEVKSSVKWCEEHEEILKYIKKQRVLFAHPRDVDLEHAKDQVKNYFKSKKQKKCCLDIINITQDLLHSNGGTQSQ